MVRPIRGTRCPDSEQVGRLIDWKLQSMPHRRALARRGITPERWESALDQTGVGDLIRQALASGDDYESLALMAGQAGGIYRFGPTMSSIVLAACRSAGGVHHRGHEGSLFPAIAGSAARWPAVLLPGRMAAVPRGLPRQGGALRPQPAPGRPGAVDRCRRSRTDEPWLILPVAQQVQRPTPQPLKPVRRLRMRQPDRHLHQALQFAGARSLATTSPPP